MRAHAPIFLFTDFGGTDLYVGQVKAVLHAEAPHVPVIDLLNDAPHFDVLASAHLLAALVQRLPPGSVTVAVVDPGVGGPRNAIALEADGRWFVGPDNGLLSVAAGRAREMRCVALDWLAQPQSVSFHGRDLFAPAAARIACGGFDPQTVSTLEVQLDPGDLEQVIYIDHYGNAMIGVRSERIDETCCIEVAGRIVAHARVFSGAAPGALLWYANSIGLIEIAANQASAADLLGLTIGQRVEVADR